MDLALCDTDQAVDGHVLDRLRAATNPADADPVHAAVRAEPEVESRAVVSLVAAAAVNLLNLRQITGDDLYPRTHAVAIRPGALQQQLNPVVFRRGIVPVGAHESEMRIPIV